MEKEIKEMAEQASIRYVNGQQMAFMAGVEWMANHSNKLLSKKDNQKDIFDAPEMVDLGLSVKWAKWDVGATKETEYGKLFAWGDIVGSEATKDGCKDKYSLKWDNEHVSNSTNANLTLAQDVANVAYGGDYRMPTKVEIKELIENTKYSVEIINGIKGGKFTAKNGNYIFFPFTGDGYFGILRSQGSGTVVWSSSCDGDDDSWCINCCDDGFCFVSSYRGYGCSVRAVCK